MNKILFCCFALVLMYPLGIDLYLVGLPQIATSLSATEADLHAAFSIYLLGMASTMILGGVAADRCGRKPVALAGALIFALASWGAITVESSHQFLVARFSQGVGAGFCYVVAFAILRDVLDDEKRAKVLSMINGITCIVPVLAPVIGHLILLLAPWPGLFMSMAVAAAAIGTLCLFALKETRHTNITNDSCPTNSISSHRSNDVSPSLKPFLSGYFLSRLFITSIGVTAILTYVNISPLLLMEQMGFSTGQYSGAMALLAGVSMTTAFATPHLLTRLGQQKVMELGQLLFLLAAMQLQVNAFSLQVSWLYITGIACICAGFSMSFGVVTSQALALFKHQAGLASSVLGVTQVSVSALYIWLMGWLGVDAISMLSGLLFAAGISCLLLLQFTRDPETVNLVQNR